MKDGIINIYKERGYTSHDVVAKLRGILKQKKTGHIGTLDPAAEGVLPVCVGKATKIAELFGDHDKTYIAEIIFGLETDTLDSTGSVLSERSIPDPEGWLCANAGRIEEILRAFTGDMMQTPPMYSAKKVGGKKLYEYAREGVELDRQPVPVKVYSAVLKDRYVKNGRPVVKAEIACSKGTYIRVMCSDIGKAEGSGACMGELLRTKVGEFSLDDAVKLGELQGSEDPYAYVIPLDEVLNIYPAVTVLKERAPALLNGNLLTADMLVSSPAEEGILRVYDPDGNLKALYLKTGEKLKPFKMFI